MEIFVAIKRLSKKSKMVDDKTKDGVLETEPSDISSESANLDPSSEEQTINDSSLQEGGIATGEIEPSTEEPLEVPIEQDISVQEEAGTTEDNLSEPSTDDTEVEEVAIDDEESLVTTDHEDQELTQNLDMATEDDEEQPKIEESVVEAFSEPTTAEDQSMTQDKHPSEIPTEQIDSSQDIPPLADDQTEHQSESQIEKADGSLDIPPLPAEGIEEPEILWEHKVKADSERLREIDRLATEELDAIDAEITALEEQILQEEMDSPPDKEFVPETEEEKIEFETIQKMEAEALDIKAEVEEMKKDIPKRVEKHDEIEVYVPKFANDDSESEENTENEGENIEEPTPASEEDTLAQEEIDKAYESGISGELDEWDRIILLPIFENRLRMSKNSLKYAYSKIKNVIMSYVDVTASFQGALENFRYDRKIILRFAIHKNTLQLYCALPVDSLDTNVYPHKKSKGDHAKATPIVVDIDSDDAIKNAIEIISVVMAKVSAIQREQFVPTAYAERYPLNPNAVLLGNEHKEPVFGQYDNDFDYAPISSEIVDGIIQTKFTKEEIEAKKDLKGRELLEDLRQTATTIKAAVALSEPVVYFFDPAVGTDSNVAYVGIQQVLNDKFLGRLIPQMFFAVAEGSDRIERFNFLALEEAVTQCNAYKEQRFALATSCRLLIRDSVFERLVKNAKTEHENLILAFDCALLEALGNLGLERIRRLRDEAGVMIMIDNSENAGMKVLTEYDMEYIRFDGRFYMGDKPRQKAHLEMMTGYAKSQNIKTTSINVGGFKEAQHMIERGVDIIQGPAAGDPKRIVTLALKSARKMPVVR